MKKINVLILISLDLRLAGTPMFCYILSKYLDKEKFNPVVVSLKEGGYFFKKIKEENNIKIYTLKNGANFFEQIKFVSRIVKSENINIIQSNFTRAAFIAQIIALFNKKIKIIISEHALFIPWYSIIPQNFLDFCTKSRLKVIYNSKATYHAIKKYRFFKSYSEVIHLGVEPRCKLYNIEKKRQKIIITSIGGFSAIRDVKSLILAINLIKNDFNIIVQLVGYKGSERYSKETYAQYKLLNELNLQSYFLILDKKSNIEKYLAKTDIYVNPTYKESFGIATVEAMLCEKPIIFANSGSLPELMIHMQEGIAFEPKNYKDLAKKLVLLIEDVKLRKKLGKAAKIKAEKYFSPSLLAKKYENIMLNFK